MSYSDVDVNLLVDIDGKDVALVLVKNVDKLYIEDIAEKVNKKAKEIKTKKGGNVCN